jgi:WD40 repeat protein/DNA-binding winged helix-turn-helix (wHTH) protein
MPLEKKLFYEFGPFRLDPKTYRLWTDGKLVELEPMVGKTLLALVQAAGKLVEKDDLIKKVWDGDSVTEYGLTRNISVLRKTLALYVNGTECIKTVPKAGYSFVLEVAERWEETPEHPEEAFGGADGQAQDQSELLTAPSQHAGQTDIAKRPSRVNLFGIALRYRNWLLVTGVVAAVFLIFDVAISHPQGAQFSKDLAAGVLAILSFYVYVTASSSRNQLSGASPQAAFRGLLPFEPSDADRFYGRDIETTALVDLVTHSEFRFGVLYGDSGCGKTSLIRASLLPRLEAKGYLAVHCRSYKNPVELLVKECRKRSSLAPDKGESAMAYIGRVAEQPDLGLIVVFDQFEEFYATFPSEREREPFVKLVRDCYQQTQLPLKFLFAIRSDFLYLIATAFDEHIADTLLASRRYHLRHFDEDQALEVIEHSVQSANWQFESGLGRRVVSDLSVDGTVLPSELQIIGEQLQNQRIFTLDQYRLAGGKEQLVHSYLEDVIKLSGDHQTAALVLRCLISEEDTRVTLSATEINKRVQRNERVVRRILHLFVKSRLVSEIQEEEPPRYELTHEYLIDKINQATGKVMDATQRANRRFRQYLSNYAMDKRTRIPITQLWSIRQYSNLECGNQERGLLKKSFWRGLVNVACFTMLLVFLVVSTAAWLSVQEEWEETLLNDGHTFAVRRAVFSPDGNLLVSCDEDGGVIVWDFARRQKLATLAGHRGSVDALAFSPDGKWFATGGFDQKVIVWDAATFEKGTVFSDEGRRIVGLAFSPNGKVLAEITTSGTILRDTTQWRRLFDLPIGGEYGATLFSADSRYLFFSPSGWWDLNKRQKAIHVDATYNWAALSPNNRVLAGIDSSGTVSFSDQQHGGVFTYKAHQDNGRAVAYSPDGQFVATGAENIILWNSISHRKIVHLSYPSIVWGLTFSPNGRWLVSTHGDGSILIWDHEQHELVASLNGHSAAVRTVAFSRDGKHIASAGEDDSVIVWDAESKHKEAVLVEHKDKVTGVAFSPDGKSLASTDFSGLIIYWDWEHARPRWSKVEERESNCLTISPNGQWIATPIAVYAAEDGARLAEMGYGSWAIAFSPDNQSLATESQGNLVVWDSPTWTDAYRRAIGPSFIALSFSPDGKLLATGDNQGPVRLWQLNPLRELAILGRHSARVKSVAFSPDGKQIASSGDDHMINLWDVRRRRKVRTIGIHASPVLSIAFSPDGKHLISGEHDGSVRIYTRHNTLWGYVLN